MARTVAVLGGGVAGLSAAHELAERGFDGAVYEAREHLRRQGALVRRPGLGVRRPSRPARRARLPLLPRASTATCPTRCGGSRFPGAPTAWRATWSRATRALLAQAGGRNELIGVMHAPGSLEDLSAVSRFLLGWATQVGIPAHEHALFVERLLTLLTSCDERRLEQLEQQSWWEFSGAERRSEAYGKFLADGLTRTLVAARAREMSARTGGLILLQLLFDLTRVGRPRRPRARRADPGGVDHAVGGAPAAAAASTLHAGAPVAGIEFDGRRITGVRVSRGPGGAGRARHAPTTTSPRCRSSSCGCCHPGAAPRRTRARAPRPARHALDERDHVLPRPRRAARARPRDLHRLGVVAHLDLAGAVLGRARRSRRTTATAASRASSRVDVSEWERPGPRTGKVGGEVHAGGDPRRGLGPARRPPQRRRRARARRGERAAPGSSTPRSSSPTRPEATNLEPLLINTAGSWADRPGGRDRDPEPRARLGLRPHAHRPRDDGGRQRGGAAGGQRDPRRRAAPPRPAAGVWKPEEPAIFGPARALDKLRWRLFRRPPKPPLRVARRRRRGAHRPDRRRR